MHCHGHAAASLGTTTAHLGTSLHLRIITHTGAVLSAALADLSTSSTEVDVEMGTPQHKIGAGLAALCAVHH